MRTTDYTHKLTEEELAILKSLIGKSIWLVLSDSIELNVSTPTLYTFYKWVELIIKGNSLDIFTLNYTFGETAGGEDFIPLSITKTIGNKKTIRPARVNVNDFTINKIQVYGSSFIWEPSSIYEKPNHRKNISNEKENISEESTLIFESKNGQMLCIDCQGSAFLFVSLTLDQELIHKTIDRLQALSNNGPHLKHTIQ